jgi:hypothetical protein
LDDDDSFDEFDDPDESLLDHERQALRSSVAAEVRSPDDPTGIDRGTFEVSGSDQDLQHAKGLLAEHGMIPAADLSGHRGAVRMWRDHCTARSDAALVDLVGDVDQVLGAPRPVPPTDGTYGEPFYAWVRPDDIPVTTDENFPYHYTETGLAELAYNLIAEAGNPVELDKILGFNFVLVTTPTSRGPVHCVTTNGNHRAAAIRAAGFPVALAQVTLQRAPWELRTFGGYAEPLYRLLYRSGLVSGYRLAEDEGYRYRRMLVDADGIAPWLLHPWIVDVDPDEVRTNLLAYEEVFGAVDDPRVEWIRPLRTFQRMLRREAMTMTEHGPDLLPRLAGHWPPRPTPLQRVEHWLGPR